MGSAPGVKSYVEFDADFPDEDEVETSEPDTPLGRPIAEHLRARLASEQLDVSEVYSHSFYGWAFDVRFDRVTVWCMLQGAPGDWLVITEVVGRWIDRLFRRSPDEKHVLVLAQLDRLLARPPFSDAKWSTQTEYHARPVPTDRGR